MDCEPLLQRRKACYQKHGLDVNDHSEDLYRKGGSNNIRTNSSINSCLIATLAAKRCLAFQNKNCELEALHYYGTPHDSKGPKSLCASFDEMHCFGNPQIMKIDTLSDTSRSSASESASISAAAAAANEKNNNRERVFAHHQKAKRQVINNRQKFNACQVISDRMHQCLRKQVNGGVAVDAIGSVGAATTAAAASGK